MSKEAMEQTGAKIPVKYAGKTYLITAAEASELLGQMANEFPTIAGNMPLKNINKIVSALLSHVPPVPAMDGNIIASIKRGRHMPISKIVGIPIVEEEGNLCVGLYGVSVPEERYSKLPNLWIAPDEDPHTSLNKLSGAYFKDVNPKEPPQYFRQFIACGLETGPEHLNTYIIKFDRETLAKTKLAVYAIDKLPSTLSKSHALILRAYLERMERFRSVGQKGGMTLAELGEFIQRESAPMTIFRKV